MHIHGLFDIEINKKTVICYEDDLSFLDEESLLLTILYEYQLVKFLILFLQSMSLSLFCQDHYINSIVLDRIV